MFSINALIIYLDPDRKAARGGKPHWKAGGDFLFVWCRTDITPLRS